MNIHINEKEAKELFSIELERLTFGSHLYGTNNDNSDLDVLILYNDPIELINSLCIQHQFQYKDETNGVDYIFSSNYQFGMNLFSGDSTINADIIMLGDYDFDTKIEMLKTYKIIKAYLGFAKRDIKMIGKDKKDRRFHAERSIRTASALLNNEILTKEKIQDIKNSSKLMKFDLMNMRDKINRACNLAYESGELNLRHNFVSSNHSYGVFQKLLESANTKEFTYGN